MKKYKVIFSPEAFIDLQEAKKWYNLQQKDLGIPFVLDIQKTTDCIRNNPFHTPIRYSNLRIAICQTFPYGIHYNINEDAHTIMIVSIFHFSRKPFWLKD